MPNPKIVDASSIKRQVRKAPATKMIESFPPGHLSTRQVAERFSVNIETIRRLARAKDENGKARFKAPSKAAKTGDLVIWVYTPEDIAELAEYFGETAPKKRGRKAGGTK